MDRYQHIGPLKFCLILSGYWDLKYIESQPMKIVYVMYRTIAFSYVLLFVLSQYAEAFIKSFEGILQVSEISQIGSVAFLYTIMAAKFLLLRGKVISKLLEEAANLQEKVDQSDDEVVKKIQQRHIKMAIMVNWYYIGGCSVVAVFVNYTHYQLYSMEWDTSRQGPRPLTFPSYKPFNVSAHYLSASLSCVVMSNLALFFYVLNLAMTSGLVIFFIAQIRTLQHHLRNFTKYIRIEFGGQNMTEEEMDLRGIVFFVNKHLTIIGYVKDFNGALQIVILLEFMILSVQLAFELFAVVTDSSNVDFYKPLLMAMNVSQIFIFYILAEQMTDEGSRLGQAVFECDWYEKPARIQKHFVFLIQNLQQPLCLTLGPFASVSTSKAVTVVKSAYSYMMLLRQSNK